MKKLLAFIVAVIATATVAHAQTFDLGAIQKQLAASPAAQQASQGLQQQMMQQALTEAANNPQLVAKMAGSLSPSQQSTIMTKAMSIGQTLFTPAEQAKLASFGATPEGAGIMAKLPQLAQQLAPTVLQMYAGAAAANAPAAGK